MLGTVGRFAGDALKKMGGKYVNTIKNLGGAEAAMMFGPDIVFGGAFGSMVPGDTADRVIGGASQGLGGALGGLTAQAFLPQKWRKAVPGLGLGADMLGSIAGDMGGYEASQQISKMRHGGISPAEQQQMDYEAQLRQEGVDGFLRENGLA